MTSCDWGVCSAPLPGALELWRQPSSSQGASCPDSSPSPSPNISANPGPTIQRWAGLVPCPLSSQLAPAAQVVCGIACTRPSVPRRGPCLSLHLSLSVSLSLRLTARLRSRLKLCRCRCRCLCRCLCRCRCLCLCRCRCRCRCPLSLFLVGL